MPARETHTFTIGGSKVRGFRVVGGELRPFEGTLHAHYKNIERAATAARRKYDDSSITLTECIAEKHRYQVPMDELMKIAEEID